MFVQVIEGSVQDREGVRVLADQWRRDVRPSASGCLGATMGVSDDAVFVGVLRFESADAAVQYADLPARAEWWEQMKLSLGFEPDIDAYPEVDVFAQGGSVQAGFVQVVRGRALDKPVLKQVEWQILEWFPSLRPDYFGSWMAWNDDRFTEVAYFESVEAAQEGEKRVDHSNHAADFDRWLNGITDVRYIDVRQPWHFE